MTSSRPPQPSSNADSGSTSPTTRPSDAEPPRIDWQSLAAGRRQIQIIHQGQVYQLRETRNGKLILTK